MATAVDVEHVDIVYHSRTGPVPALSDVHLSVRPGEFVSLLGPSGCGKSTLLLAVAGLIGCSRGVVRVGETPVTAPIRQLGYVFQEPLLLEWRTAVNNVLLQVEMRGLPPVQYRKAAQASLQRMGLHGFEDKHSFELSGGMRQRVAIARALIHDPPLLLMDEPFGALDALTREQMRVDLEQLWLDIRNTVLFVTHDITEAILLSDRVAIMTPRPGHVVEVLPIPLPRPRTERVLADPTFLQCRARIKDVLNQIGVLHA